MNDTERTTATPEEVEERVNMAFVLMVDHGFSQRKIVDYMHTKTEWGAALTKRQLRNYVYAAREELSKMATEIDRREHYATAVMRLNEQYRKANQLNDTARAIQAIQAMVTLMKLDQPQAAMDWRKLAVDQGLDPVEVFERMVKAAADVTPQS